MHECPVEAGGDDQKRQVCGLIWIKTGLTAAETSMRANDYCRANGYNQAARSPLSELGPKSINRPLDKYQVRISTAWSCLRGGSRLFEPSR
jgi:hypothetical protein